MKPTVIVDFIDGECEVTGKNGECYVIRTEQGTNSNVTPSKLLEMIRYSKRQELKAAAAKLPEK